MEFKKVQAEGVQAVGLNEDWIGGSPGVGGFTTISKRSDKTMIGK